MERQILEFPMEAFLVYNRNSAILLYSLGILYTTASIFSAIGCKEVSSQSIVLYYMKESRCKRKVFSASVPVYIRNTGQKKPLNIRQRYNHTERSISVRKMLPMHKTNKKLPMTMSRIPKMTGLLRTRKATIASGINEQEKSVTIWKRANVIRSKPSMCRVCRCNCRLCRRRSSNKILRSSFWDDLIDVSDIGGMT